MTRWTVEKLKERMREYNTSEFDWEVLKEPLSSLSKAAVLIPLTIVNDELHVWLTKRSNQVGNDKGHVSFPGGMRDERDQDAVSTALREAEEEVGLSQDHLVSILGIIPPWINIRNTLITPVVALVTNDFQPMANEEVEFAFQVPLERFLSKENHWHTTLERINFPSYKYLHFFKYLNSETSEEAVTFGLTATMCITLACALIGRAPEFQYSSAFQIEPSNPFRSQLEFLHMFTVEKNVLEYADSSTQSKL